MPAPTTRRTPASCCSAAFEPKAKPWGVDGIPEDFCFDELPEDFDHFAPILKARCIACRSLEKVGIRKFFNGPESFTADQRYLLGEAPTLKNFFVAAGFNSIGIQSGGGVGWALAALDRRRASRRSTCGTSTSAAAHAAPQRQVVPGAARLRGAGPALRDALAVPPVRDLARHPQVAVLCAGNRARRLLRRGRGL